jgi:LuxR family maltose regulon positive regulatory protein
MLERANLFIIPLDEERRWYRYHHLFADLLRRRLRRSYPELIPVLHGRASRWFEQNDMLPQAIDQAFAARDYARAAALVEQAAPQMEETFQSAAWLNWVRALPEELLRARPLLCVQIAGALIDNGEVDEVEPWLHEAENLLAAAAEEGSVEDDGSLQSLPAVITLTRASVASYQGDNARATRYAELALAQIPEEDLMLRSQAAAIAGLASWSLGDLQTAEKTLVDWINSTHKLGVPLFAIASAFGVADIRIALGRLQDAIHAYDEALLLAQDVDQQLLPITAHHHLGLAMLYHEMGEEAKAAHHLQISSELGRRSTLIDWPYRSRLAHAHLNESAGELDAALALLDDAKRVYITNPVPDARPVEALKAGIYLKQGHLQRAQEWVQAEVLAIEDELSYLNEFKYLTLAKLLIAEYAETGDEHALQQAGYLLDRLLRAAEEGKRAGSVIEILLQQALAYQALGDLPLALASIERAMILAEPEGYLRIFVDEGPPMARLLREANARAIAPTYTQKLLAAVSLAGLEKTDPSKTKSDIRHPTSDIVESLSDRELEVLHLVADGLTNKQIAERLYVTLNTVKAHTRNIYGKLDVHHRAEAVAKARALGMI